MTVVHIAESLRCCYNCEYFWQDKWSRNNPCARGQCRRFPPTVMHDPKLAGNARSWFPYVDPQWRCGEFTKRGVIEV